MATVTSTKALPGAAYPIGAVARMTGIEAETLRMWERRHRLGPSARSEGGHRLYSEDDVTLLRAVKVLLEAGMRIGAVASMPREQIAVEADRLASQARAGSALDDVPRLLDEIINAALALDHERAAELLDRPRLFADGTEVVRAVYMPLMHLIGERWAEGRLPVGVEHFTEKLVTTRLLAIFQGMPDGRGRRALCACAPGERHECGLIAAAIELRAAGFEVSLLGADLPATELAAAARTTDAQVLVVALTMSPGPAARDALVNALQAEPLASVPLVLGGRAAPALAARLTRPATVAPSIPGVVAAASS